MSLSESDLQAIVAAASTIPERMNNHILPDAGQTNDELLQERLQAWCQVSTAGNWQRFEERLSWDGLDLTGAFHVLAPGVWNEQIPLPTWTTTLQDALHLLETMPGENTFVEKDAWTFLDATTPLPFEELLAPFVAIARWRFLAQSRTAADLLTGVAQVSLQRHLLQVLVSLSLPTLHAEFVQGLETTGNHKQRDSGEFSRHFVQYMCQGGMAALLQTYSVLARLLATTCDLWVEATVEFVQRLASDWQDITEMFGDGDDLGQVIEIQPALSDTHAGRRCVMALTFACGTRLVYKPRGVGMEAAFASLLRWCNEQGAMLPFKVLKILNRDSYGWVEFVAPELCADQKALRRYYQRAGMLLCLMYVLGGMNCFSDQLIAHGEQPVLVDTGYLLHPYPSPDPTSRQGEDWEQEVYSVLHTGLLASWHMPTNGSLASPREATHYAGDISGFCLSLGNEDSTQEARQQQSLKPSSILKYGSLKTHTPLNVATAMNVSHYLPIEYVHADLQTGFQHMYQLLLRQRRALLAIESPLQAMRKQMVRMPYRDRSAYVKLFPKLLEPHALRDAITRSLLLEPLGSESVPIEWFRVSKRDYTHWWPIFAAERQALLQGDIPVVNTRAGSDAIMIGPDQEVASCLCQSAFDLMLRRVERLSDEDMNLQLALLRHALPQKATLTASTWQTVTTGSQPEEHTFMTQALAIAEDIASRVVEIGQEGVLWVKSEASYRFQQSQLHPMRYGFSDGISGIAFFLAALAHLTGNVRYRKLASIAVRPLHRLVHEEGKRLVREMGPGAGPGLGSVVYALTRLSQFLDEPELLADAQAVARFITPDLIAQDHLLDVFVGTAGTLLGLLAIYEVSPSQDLLDRAMWCGEHLLRTRTPSKANCRAWPTMGGRHTSGFAHGTAGIVYALLRLYALTGDASLLEAAHEGLHYEDCAFVYERRNWIEEIGTGRPDFGVSWCHGAPGIGLARIGGLSVLDTASIRQDIEVALQTTRQIGAMGPNHLCCGICGRAEFLLTAARRLDRPELANVAMQTVREMFTGVEQRGAFFFGSVLPAWVARPDLFHGTAGIGYMLLRMAHPDVLPSILLWE